VIPVVGLIIVAAPLLLFILLRGLGGFLVVADPVNEVDAIVVLSGGEDHERLAEVAKLYNERVAPWVIITETQITYPGTNTPYTGIHKRELIDQGVPEDAIIITQRTVSSTWGEARIVRKLMLRRGMTSCIVVTDPFHTFRTRLIFRSEFEEHDLNINVRPAAGHWYDPALWWLTAEGREATINEYTKLLSYLLGHREQ